MPEKLGAYSGGIRAATSQFSGAGEGGPKLIAFEADVTNNGPQLIVVVVSRDELWKAAKAVWKKTATKDKCAAAFRLKKRMLAAIVEDGGGYPRKRPKVG